VLAVATFSSVRSANRAARIAERAFEIGLRPIMAPSRLEDPTQEVMFRDRHWVTLEGGRAVGPSSRWWTASSTSPCWSARRERHGHH
jgi:hypothetical protein